MRSAAAAILLGALAGCGEPTASPDPAEESGSPHVGTAAEPLFVDATAESGIDFRHVHGGLGNRESPETMGGGVGLLDFDRDGDLDAYFAQSGPVRTPGDRESRAGGENALFANRGDARFERVPGAAGADDDGYGMGCAVGDLDGDGWDDLLALNWGPDGLYRNGQGRFTEVTEEWGFGRRDTWSVSAAFFDSDADGDLDLYVVGYVVCAPSSHLIETLNSRAPRGFRLYPTPDVFPAERDRFLLNDGTGHLAESGVEAGIAAHKGKGLGIVVTDIELDGRPDLYVVNDGTPNFLFHNQGGNRFLERGQELGVAFNDDGASEAGMGVDCADVDDDGDFDLFVTNLDDETNSLYLNAGGERLGFRDRTRYSGLSEPSRALLGFGALFEDVDLDGDVDLFLCNGHLFDNVELVHAERTYPQPNQLFMNEGGTFRPAPELLGPDATEPAVSRGSAAGDLDGDGRRDLLIGNNDAAPQLLLSRAAADDWVQVVLEGPPGNPRGLGAVAELVATDGTRRLRRVESARSYASASEPAIVSGIPGGLHEVVVTWPTGQRERFDSAAAGSGTWTLRFGSGRPE